MVFLALTYRRRTGCSLMCTLPFIFSCFEFSAEYYLYNSSNSITMRLKLFSFTLLLSMFCSLVTGQVTEARKF